MSALTITKRIATPATTEQLAQAGYHAWSVELQRLGGSQPQEWERLSSADTKAWLHATTTIASRVTFTGCPRPLDLAGDVCEATRCAEWLLHVADGGDAGSDDQLRMLLRTAAGLLVRPVDSGGVKPMLATAAPVQHQVGGAA